MPRKLAVRVQIPARICLTVLVEEPKHAVGVPETQLPDVLRPVVREKVEELLKELPALDDGWELGDLTGLVDYEPCMVLYGPAQGKESQPRKGEVQVLDVEVEEECCPWHEQGGASTEPCSEETPIGKALGREQQDGKGVIGIS